MTMPTLVPVPVVAANADLVNEALWDAWKARGRIERAETAGRMRIVAALVAVGLAGWLVAAIRAIA